MSEPYELRPIGFTVQIAGFAPSHRVLSVDEVIDHVRTELTRMRREHRSDDATEIRFTIEQVYSRD